MSSDSRPPETTVERWPADEAYLASLVDAARQEQSQGYPGWCKGRVEYLEPLHRLKKRGLVSERVGGWFMPTDAGFAMIEREGHA